MICKCTHPLSNHGIQNGCMECACNLSRDGVTVVAQAVRIKELEAETKTLNGVIHMLIDERNHLQNLLDGDTS